MNNNLQTPNVHDLTKDFSPDAKKQFAEDAMRLLSNNDQSGVVSSLVEGLSAGDQRGIASAALNATSPNIQKEVAMGVISAVGGGASPQIRDWLWLVVIGAFSLVLFGSFVTLAVSVFVASPSGATSAQMILTVFTGVVGFLAGLFAPSPVSNSQGGKG